MGKGVFRRKKRKLRLNKKTTTVRIAKSIPRGVSNSKMGFPKTQTVKMRYTDVVSLDLTANNGRIQYSLLNIHDPQILVGGHQPLGYDQWSAFYNHYVVKSCKISFYCTTSTFATPFLMGIHVSDDIAVDTTGLKLAEKGRGNFRMLTQYSQGKDSMLSLNFNTKRFFNVKDIKDNYDELGAVFGASPTDDAVATLYVEGLGNVGAGPVQGMLNIDYLVEVAEPKDLAQS